MLGTVDTDEEDDPSFGEKTTTKGKNLRARETHDDNSREVHKDTVDPKRKTIAMLCPGETSLHLFECAAIVPGCR